MAGEAMTRIEVYKAGVLSLVHVAPNANAARVFTEHHEGKGVCVLVFWPRTESERVS